MKNYFNYKREEKVNFNVGLMSFQHFDGEKLYADLVVSPDRNMTETENVECYPVSAGAIEIERDEGYYPRASVVYIRTLWKEFEPRRNEYNYGFIEEILKKAEEKGQVVAFRLMAHSTRAEDDVPDWLKELIPCPERPEGMRVKDSPTDHLFIELFCKAIRAFGARFDGDPRLASVDISVPGAWGEGHKLEEFGDAVIWEMVESYLDAFPTTQLMCQVGLPEILHKARERRNVGVRGDGYGEPYHTNEHYPVKMSRVEGVWKVAPVSFESYWWLGEWQRKGWDIDALIEKSLSWHISTFNAKSMPVPPEWREKIDGWVDKMGYHYTVRWSECDGACIKVALSNVGVAPIYQKLPLVIRLRGKKTYDFDTGYDLTLALPGEFEVDFPLDLTQIDRGEYSVELGIVHSQGNLYLATDIPRTPDGFYPIGRIEN